MIQSCIHKHEGGYWRQLCFIPNKWFLSMHSLRLPSTRPMETPRNNLNIALERPREGSRADPRFTSEPKSRW